ncbi:hypothetical protein BV898_16497 [Hypsibius exemplaris]|uniref:E3 ubiquitin-protein ligase n=1 Tax=Hypsibius exemplaris TaxID=2072580 RepID=A0A9X6RLJ0_HYPEX|nr:hypothetical protein BV898_16497 [Hypsibius exemplaris]
MSTTTKRAKTAAGSRKSTSTKNSTGLCVILPDSTPSSSSAAVSSSTPLVEDPCCVCTDAPLHPIRLPCSHIFCFLCIKGVFLTDPKCPMCRADIPRKCIEEPKVFGESPKTQGSRKRKKPPTSSSSSSHTTTPTPVTSLQTSVTSPQTSVTSPARQVWLYEARDGRWWQYDERTLAAIEDAQHKGMTDLEVVLAGRIYVLDFAGKVQMRKDNPALKRQMKKDFVDGTVKGVAGLLVAATD